MIDSGLFQGLKELRLRNWRRLPIEPADLDAVVITHAHLDHCGYLPRLVKDDFRGRIHLTENTAKLAAVVLRDSARIQTEDAKYAAKEGFSKHNPPLPLYDEHDANQAINQFQSHPFGQRIKVAEQTFVTFYPAGHILGAAFLHVEFFGKNLIFSGDLGRDNHPLLVHPAAIPQLALDAIVTESTYGDREHPDEDTLAELGPALQRVAARGGTAVLPVFAVGRAQEILHAIVLLKANGVLPHSLPVYLDSPMAIHTTDLYDRHIGEHRLNAAQCRDMEHVAKMTRSADESKAIAMQHGPKIVLAAAGMATGGRVLHHLVQYLGHHRNMVVLTGYQAPGTRGASLSDGATKLRIHGQDVPVRAEVVQMQSASAHADASQLMDWLRAIPAPPRRVFVTHGDMGASDALRHRIETELRWQAMVPEHGSTWAA